MQQDETYQAAMIVLNELTRQTKLMDTVIAKSILAKVSIKQAALDEAYLLSHQAKLRSLCKEILSLAKSIKN